MFFCHCGGKRDSSHPQHSPIRHRREAMFAFEHIVVFSVKSLVKRLFVKRQTIFAIFHFHFNQL